MDIVDVATEGEHLTIEIFNRAISFVNFDSEGVRSIHRICETLRAVAAGGTEAVRPPEPAAGPRRRGRMRLPNQAGMCELCHRPVTFAESGDHAVVCAGLHDGTAGDEKTLVQLLVTAPGLSAYWLRLEARTDSKLEALDGYLRDIWLECCGHLSMFRIGNTEYHSQIPEEFDMPFLGRSRPRPVKKTMSVRLAAALPPVGTPIEYEYDFGSTTTLQLQVEGERHGRIGRASVRLLARNEPVAWPCAICGAPATLVCPFCPGDPAGLVCSRHRKRHPCEDADDAFRPVVNSPRMGVCGYTGP